MNLYFFVLFTKHSKSKICFLLSSNQADCQQRKICRQSPGLVGYLQPGGSTVFTVLFLQIHVIIKDFRCLFHADIF